MSSFSRSLMRAAVAIVALAALVGCGLPRPGPNAEEIVAGSKRVGGDLNVVFVDGQIAGRAFVLPDTGFSQDFLALAEDRSDRINPGDTLSVTVWENVDNGLLVSLGQKLANLEQIQVDQRGEIFIPYAGTIRAQGLTPSELRQVITRELGNQTPDPQVEVRRVAGDGATVNLIGAVGAQGVYPVTPATSKLAPMLAQAGGATVDPEIAVVTVRRSGRSGSIFLKDLFENPALDIALRKGDTIIVEADRRSFNALGATVQQARVPFPAAELSALDALAVVGGLNPNLSDPTGIFVFRRETATVANRVAQADDLTDGEPFAYVIDLTQPQGFFVAKDFQIRDDDTIYITEAPFVAWARVLEATAQTLNFLTTVSNLIENATDT